MMNPRDIIEILSRENDGNLPELILQQAIEQWSEVRPYLMSGLRKMPEDMDEDLFFYTIFLVAEQRDKEAFPLLIDFFSVEGENAADALGDTITESLHKILASTYDGNFALLSSLIKKKSASVWCRDAALKAVLVLLHKSVLQRDVVVKLFRELFATVTPKDDDCFISLLVSVCCTMNPRELMPEIEQAFEQHSVDLGMIQKSDVNKALHDAPAQGFSSWKEAHYQFINSTVDELRGWHCFSEHYRQSLQKTTDTPLPEAPVLLPVRQTAKIGRNEPCSCGSGKKYKKCCLNKSNGR